MEPAAAAPSAAPVLAIDRFEDLIALAAAKRDLVVKAALERDVRLVHCEDGKLEVALEPSAAKTLVGDLARKLSTWTGRRWMVVVSAEAGAATVRAQIEAQKAELLRGVRADPLVQAVLAKFPGAEIVGVNRRETAPAAPGGPHAGASDDGDSEGDEPGPGMPDD
jgi:DNA polymerase-3 subunit gamma/tau